jgi:hypothetical protein
MSRWVDANGLIKETQSAKMSEEKIKELQRTGVCNQ